MPPGLQFNSPRPPASPQGLLVILSGALLCSLVGISLAPSPWVWPASSAGLAADSATPDPGTWPASTLDRPLITADTAVRVTVYPQRFALAPGQSGQACAFFQFADGKIGRRSGDAVVAACDSIWRAEWSPALRAVSLSQQLAIDARCATEWAASGGVIAGDGWFRSGGFPGEYRLSATSAAGPCPAAGQSPAGMLHRRWRITHHPGGGLTLSIDPRGEWNTMADLLAWRIESPLRAMGNQVAWAGR